MGVTSLVGKSLSANAARRQNWGKPRFMMLETIREYAREKLEEGVELDSTRDRHLDYFLTLCRGCGAGDTWE